jgi:hypothetical protein
VVSIIKEENSHKKDHNEAKARSAIIVPNKKATAIILSAIGGGIYLFTGIGFYSITWLRLNSFVLLSTGIVSLLGAGIGIEKIKLGGWIVFLSIPFSILIGTLYVLINHDSIYGAIYCIPFLLYPLPFPHSLFAIPGGILGIVSSDKL